MATIYEEVELLKTQVATLQGQVTELQPKALVEGENLNDLAVGVYYVPSTIISSTLLNKPTSAAATAVIQVYRGGDHALIQRYFPADKAQHVIWERTHYSGEWGSWHIANHTDTGWIDLPLTSGITPHNAVTFPCKYRKIGNKVHVRGCIKGISEINKVVAILPEGFRPVSSFYAQRATDGGNTTTFNVRTNGEIKAVNSTHSSQNVALYHFINMEFLVD